MTELLRGLAIMHDRAGRARVVCASSRLLCEVKSFVGLGCVGGK